MGFLDKLKDSLPALSSLAGNFYPEAQPYFGAAGTVLGLPPQGGSAPVVIQTPPPPLQSSAPVPPSSYVGALGTPFGGAVALGVIGLIVLVALSGGVRSSR